MKTIYVTDLTTKTTSSWSKAEDQEETMRLHQALAHAAYLIALGHEVVLTTKAPKESDR